LSFFESELSARTPRVPVVGYWIRFPRRL